MTFKGGALNHDEMTLKLENMEMTLTSDGKTMKLGPHPQVSRASPRVTTCPYKRFQVHKKYCICWNLKCWSDGHGNGLRRTWKDGSLTRRSTNSSLLTSPSRDRSPLLMISSASCSADGGFLSRLPSNVYMPSMTGMNSSLSKYSLLLASYISKQ